MRDDKFSSYLHRFLEETHGSLDSSKEFQASFRRQYDTEHDPTLRNHLTEVMGDIRGKRVLEVGSGSGWRTVSLGLMGAQAYGIEPVESGVRASNERGKRYPDLKVECKVGRAEEVPYPNGFFDAVISFQVIEHVTDIDKSLRESYRVLKKGGYLYMETGNYNFPREEHYGVWWIPHMPKSLGKLYVSALGKDPKYLDDINYIFKGRTLRRMRRVGFTEVRDRYEDYVRDKFRKIENIKSRHLRTIMKVSRAIGLSQLRWRKLVLLVKTRRTFNPSSILGLKRLFPSSVDS